MRDAVRAFGLIPIEQEGFEADDLIATYARVALEAGADVSIIAGDKDLMQLVRPGVMMFDPMPGNERRIGPAEVAEKFGVPPEKVADVQALIGDPTDNVPGVPGIGVKTAAQLIGEYGDLETLLSRTSEIKQEKRRQSLIEFAEKARMSKRLVLLDDHVELARSLDDLPLDGRDPKVLIAFLKAMEFTSLTKRVGEATGVDPNAIDPDPAMSADRGDAATTAPAGLSEPATPAAATASAESGVRPGALTEPAAAPATTAARQLSLGLPPVAADSKRTPPGRSVGMTPLTLVRERMAEASAQKVDRTAYQTIGDAAALERFIAQGTDQGFIAVDLMTSSVDPMIATLIGVALATAPNRAAYIPLSHRVALR
jgi:DNA polymerase-1